MYVSRRGSDVVGQTSIGAWFETDASQFVRPRWAFDTQAICTGGRCSKSMRMVMRLAGVPGMTSQSIVRGWSNPGTVGGIGRR